MENYTNINGVQQSYLQLTDLGQNTHFPYNDFLRLPNPNSLQDLNSSPTDTHQAFPNSTCEIASDSKTTKRVLDANVL